MKRTGKIIITAVIVSCIVLQGCGQEQNATENENLTIPQYETSSLSGKIESEESTTEVVDGYERFKSGYDENGDVYIDIPYVKNRVPGVMYFFDDFRKEYLGRIPFYSDVNRPDGTQDKKNAACGFFACFSSPTKRDIDSGLKSERTNPPYVIKEAFEIYGAEPNDKHYSMTYQDVQAVSFALYEDFYEEIPKVMVRVYGVPRELWERELGSDLTFEYDSYEAFIEQCKSNEYTECVLMGEKELDSTGVYYIDYKKLAESGDFINYFVDISFDRSIKWTYNIDGSCTYDINNESLFQEWKNEHTDKIIAGK